MEIIESLLDKGMSVNWTDADFLLRYIFLLQMVIWKQRFFELRNFRFKKTLYQFQSMTVLLKM